MPTYNYKCTTTNCTAHNQIIEVTHSIKAPKPNCPICGNVYSVHHTSAPTVSYVGKWFKNNGSY